MHRVLIKFVKTKKGLAEILLLLALTGSCIETMPISATTLIGKALSGQLSQFQGFRLLAVEGYASAGHPLRSAEYLIRRLTHFPNWNNITFPSYIQLLSAYNETEIVSECKEFYSGDATKFNVQRLIRDFLGQADPDELAIFYIMTNGELSILKLDEIITAAELRSWLEASEGTLSVVIDACLSGSWINDGDGSTFRQNKLTLCSCKSNQLSYGVSIDRSLVPVWGGYFTGFEDKRYPNGTDGPVGVIGATKAAKDVNEDGWLSVLELFQFAKLSTEQYTAQLGEDYMMNPVCYNGLGFDLQFIQLSLQRPTAEFSCVPSVAWVNETVEFNASSSYNPNGNITSYRWDFGDGNITIDRSNHFGLP